MSNSFRKIFWGFFLVLVEINILIDILPDPVGYFLIISGLSSLIEEFTIGKKALNWAIVLCILSIPSVFVSQHSINQTINPLSFWHIYISVLALLKIILVFYMFQLMVRIAREWRAENLLDWTFKFSKIYLVFMFIFLMLQSFHMNVNTDFVMGISVVCLIGALIVEIMFLVLLRRFKKLDEDFSDSNNSTLA
ncbi:hypothetical protein GMD78_13530 [Ornithinibacillus sp. L9]|uniref:Uncharacterized protein n=1 Tax=Ornithinibacillus caprae TaxID=2678566 RepID=A0A6N8FLY1_9BACI|nr:hypothetical protein [Ornithinibacillus caprae]MUK89384.1 hypothetical protein [Ornithinibacillus caprae]